MNTQERIQKLAMAALRSAPPTGSIPKPATFMADPEKLKAAIPVAMPVAKEAPAAAAPAVPLEVREVPAAPAFKDEADSELRTMIEQRELGKARSLKIRSLSVTLTVLAVIGGAGAWVAVSPSAQAKVAKVVPLFQESLRDVQSLANTKENFDASLEKVAVHGGRIDEATRAMGVGPASAGAHQGAEINAAMGAMMGGEGSTASERNAELRQNFGFVEKLAESKDL